MSRSDVSLGLNPDEIGALLSLFPEGVVAVDLETTGLSPLVDKIIEIAAVKVLPTGEVSTYHQLINPLIEVPEFTVKFHGLTNRDLDSAPTIKKPLRTLWEFLGRLPVIAHNSTFDLGYLIKASHDFQIDFPPLDVYDSCRFLRAAWKKVEGAPENYRLSTLCNFYQIPLRHHQALDDTLACLKVTAAVLSREFDRKAALEKSFVFRLSSFDRNDCFNFSTRLNGLRDLVIGRQLVELDYRGKNMKGVRPVRPIGLMPLPSGPVLFGECLLSGMNKSFLLKKIRTYSRLEASLWHKETTLD